MTERDCMLRRQVSRILVSSMALASPAIAQEAARGGLEEVVVTAQRREESLQDAPIAITALSSETLELRGITDFGDVAHATPSMSLTPYPSSTNTLILYMRGQGVADSMQITSDGSVALYQDGFYISRPQLSTFDLADIDRVEVLRGPQGTLYGRNTTGGAVNLISKRPSGELDFKQELSMGSREYFRTLSALDLPTWHGLSSKFTYLYSRKDGLVDNLNEFGRDYQEVHQRAGRVALAWDGGGAFTADYFFEIGDIDSTPIYYQVPALVAPPGNPFGGIPGYDASGKPAEHTWRPIDLPMSSGEYTAHGLTLAWDVNDNFTIKSLTGYRDLDDDIYQNYASAFSTPGSPFPTEFVTFDTLDTDQFTQEFQFLGSIGERFDYLVGLYYFKEEGDHFQHIDIDIPLPFIPAFGLFGPIAIDKDRDIDAESESQAIFAQFTWTPPILDDRLELTFGGRYTEDNRKATRTTFNIFRNDVVAFPTGIEPDPSPLPPNYGNSIDKDFSKFNPAFTANMLWTDDLSTYLRVATGYKAGGTAESGPVGTFDRTFEPEEILTYELGLKSMMADNRVRVNAALFYSEFDDMQLGFNTNPADLSEVLLQNAGEATVGGLELEVAAAPTDNLNLGLSYTYLDPEIDRVDALPGTIFDPATNPLSPYQVGDNIANLFALPYTSENSYNVSADWTFARFGASALSAHLNYRWEDDFFASAPAGPGVPNREFYQIDAHDTLDARLMWSFDLSEGRQMRLSVWGTNILDDETPQHIIGQGAIIPLRDQDPTTPDVPAGYTHSVYSWRGEAEYGVDLVVEF
jgi:iron complex outermembrane receptor protein